MDTETQRALLDHITGEFHTLRADKWAPVGDELWPWGVWIRLHDPVRAEAVEIDLLPGRDGTPPIRKVWFLDAHGLRERDPWQFVRFWTVQIQHRWSDAGWFTSVEDAAIRSPRNRIGVVGFAEIADSGSIYLDTLWGPRWGRGQRIVVRDEIAHILEDFWVT